MIKHTHVHTHPHACMRMTFTQAHTHTYYRTKQINIQTSTLTKQVHIRTRAHRHTHTHTYVIGQNRYKMAARVHAYFFPFFERAQEAERDTFFPFNVAKVCEDHPGSNTAPAWITACVMQSKFNVLTAYNHYVSSTGQSFLPPDSRIYSKLTSASSAVIFGVVCLVSILFVFVF